MNLERSSQRRACVSTGPAAAALVAALLAVGCAHEMRRFPDPEHGPATVVRLQVEALARHDEPQPGAGIAVAFRFASPANKSATGPLERFELIVRSPAYRPMLGHVAARYGPVFVRGDAAVQHVVITASDGSLLLYQFTLTRQLGGEFDGCWMTDSVVLEDAELGEGVEI